MLRTVVRLSPNFVIPIFGSRNEYDYNELDKKVSEKPATGWERVKKMFRRNEYDEVSAELHTVIQGGLAGCLLGACFGGFLKSRLAYLNFIESNQATVFTSTGQAKKKLQDQVTIAFAKGAYHWGWRLGIFSGMFSLLSTTIAVYKDESSLAEYIAAGAITGGLYKANLGLAASVVGAGLGAALSLVAGSLILLLLKVTGVSMTDVRKSMTTLKVAREEQFNSAKEKAAEIKHDDVTRHHDKLIEQKGEKKLHELA